jgi:hypothetical protein
VPPLLQGLFKVSNLFYLGSFQAAIAAGEALTLDNDAVRTERDVFVYRSYVVLGCLPLRGADAAWTGTWLRAEHK